MEFVPSRNVKVIKVYLKFNLHCMGFLFFQRLNSIPVLEITVCMERATVKEEDILSVFCLEKSLKPP